MLQVYKDSAGVPNPLTFLFILTGDAGSSSPFTLTAVNLANGLNEATGVTWSVEEQTNKVFRAKSDVLGEVGPITINAGRIDAFHPGGDTQYATLGVSALNILDSSKVGQHIAANEDGEVLVAGIAEMMEAFGDKGDAPATQPVGAAEESIVSLLKAIALNTDTIELKLSNTGDLYLSVDELEARTGTLTAGKEVNPDAASASLTALSRGNIQKLIDVEGAVSGVQTRLGDITSSSETDPNAASASVNSLLRGILNRLIIGDNQTGTELTAPDESTAFDTDNFSNHNFQVTIANIDTNVVLRVEGSFDNTNWFNVDSAGDDITYTANGTYLLQRSDVSMPYMRLYFVSESGGTAATINSIYRGGN